MNRFSQPRRNPPLVRQVALGAVVATLGACGDSGELVVEHAPSAFSRRAGAVSANVTGTWSGGPARPLEWSLNGGPWRQLVAAGSRMPGDRFSLELLAEDLTSGPNTLVLGTAGRRLDEVVFTHDVSPIVLPLQVDWAAVGSRDLDVQDGAWEVVAVDGGGGRGSSRASIVRPVPGTEDYDRLVLATGAFAGPREIETVVVFRTNRPADRWYGFGVIPLWGGHLDEDGVRPRRGWSYGICWFYSRWNGVGVEFSRKVGDAPMNWVASYAGFEPEPGVRYGLVACADRPTGRDAWRLRLKWWKKDGEPEPAQWGVEVEDRHGAPLDEREFAVGLVAHRTQVEFGDVSVRVPSVTR